SLHDALPIFLPNDIAVEKLVDLVGRWQAFGLGLDSRFQLLADDVVAQVNTFIADIHAGAGNQLAHLVLALAAKGAVKNLALVGGLAHSKTIPVRPLGVQFNRYFVRRTMHPAD